MASPAENVIGKCGGPHAVAKICGVHVTRVYRWTYEREKGGTGGFIPTRHQDQILAAARQQGLDLSPSDFFTADPAAPPTAPSPDDLAPHKPEPCE